MFFNKKTAASPFTESLKATTTARLGIGHCGGRYPTDAHLAFQMDFAAAKDAVHRETGEERIRELGLLAVSTLARTRAEYLSNTNVGRRLDEAGTALLRDKAKRSPDVQILTSDGLSAEAFERNVPDMLGLLSSRLTKEGLTLGTPIFIRRARVAVMDYVGEVLKPRASLILIGERPGLGIRTR